MTKLRVLAFTTIVTLLWAGCGSPSGGGGADALQMIAASSTRTQAAGTASVEMTIDMEAMGQKVHMVGRGQNDVDAQRSQMTMEMDSEMAPIQGSIEIVTDGTKVYMKYPEGTLGLPGKAGGKPWAMFDAESMGGAGGLNGFSGLGQPGSGDPTQYLEFLKGVSGDVETVGTEDVRGVGTTHYKATLDFEKVIEQASSEAKAELDASLDQFKSQLGTTEMPMEVWIDDDGLMRRMAMSFSAGTEEESGSFSMTMTIEMFDFGKPVDIQIPPASDVTDVSEMMGNMGTMTEDSDS